MQCAGIFSECNLHKYCACGYTWYSLWELGAQLSQNEGSIDLNRGKCISNCFMLSRITRHPCSLGLSSLPGCGFAKSQAEIFPLEATCHPLTGGAKNKNWDFLHTKHVLCHPPKALKKSPEDSF